MNKASEFFANKKNWITEKNGFRLRNTFTLSTNQPPWDFFQQHIEELKELIDNKEALLSVCKDLQGLLCQDSLLPMLDLKERVKIKKAEDVITKVESD